MSETSPQQVGVSWVEAHNSTASGLQANVTDPDPAAESWGTLPAGKLVLVLMQSVGVFLVAGVFEIGGGWLVWGNVREGKPYWWSIVGGLVLAAYGFVATLQPSGLDFGRVYAAYGGYFILLSLLWGVYIDKSLVMDWGDILGCALAIASAACICFWPR